MKMRNRYVGILIGGIVGVGVTSLIVGKMQWGLLVGLLIGISITEWRTNGKEKPGDAETDKKVINKIRKFMLSTMGLSFFLLLIYLVVCDKILDQQFIEVRYLIYYVLATFFICLFIGPAILRRK
ncbi:hypothetical protein ACW2QC_14345 [Virgibacillus sp. FSP13]